VRRYIKFLPFSLILLAVVVFSVLYTWTKNGSSEIKPPTDDTRPPYHIESTKTDISKNNIFSASYVEMDNHEIVLSSEGSEKKYKVPGKIFILCLNEHPDSYYNLITNPEVVDSSLMVERNTIETLLSSGDEIEVFTYANTPSDIYLKGIVFNECF